MEPMNKKPFNLDERETNTFRSVCTLLYLLTIFSLMIIQLYRQFVLNQPQEAWNDIAMLLTVNILALLGLTLYLTGVINPRRIKLRDILIGYALFVLAGFLITIFKYAVLLGQEINLAQVWSYLSTVVIISGIIVLALALLACLGNRRIDKQIS
jgi:glucan phosphoethanolaminetransferase (alkaline phosphatase superfamily)